MRAWTPRFMNDVQRLLLARRLVQLGARTGVISEWCGLSMVQARSLFREMGASEASGSARRRRGPNPTSIRLLMRSERWRDEAAGLISLCFVFGAMPTHPLANPERDLPDVGRGERFVRAFDLYRSVSPGRSLDFSDALAIFVAVASGTQVYADRCQSCEAVIIRDAGYNTRFRCLRCVEWETRPSARCVS